jgi:hypothetical protein
MYFLMLDRFANDQAPPKSQWNQRYEYRQGGTFRGVTAQLDYLHRMGVKALWLSPILKNPQPNWKYNYTGYDTQDFLHIDERLGSDGTLAGAEKELCELVEQAHAREMHVIVDIVINHAARVFDYLYHGQIVSQFTDSELMKAPPGTEPPIMWLDGYGFPRRDWQDQIPPDAALSPDDAVYPKDLQEKLFFAFSRIVSEIEVLVVANTGTQTPFDGLILQDPDLNRPPRPMQLVYSNLGNTGSAMVRHISGARFFSGPEFTSSGDVAALPVGLAPMECQVWVPTLFQ